VIARRPFCGDHLIADSVFGGAEAGYLKLEARTFVGGNKIVIDFKYRTPMRDALLMFAFGGTGTYFLLQLEAGTLLWQLSVNGEVTPHTFESSSLSLCDGDWHHVQLTRRGTQMKIAVDDELPRTSSGDPTEVSDVLNSSPGQQGPTRTLTAALKRLIKSYRVHILSRK